MSLIFLGSAGQTHQIYPSIYRQVACVERLPRFSQNALNLGRGLGSATYAISVNTRLPHHSLCACVRGTHTSSTLALPLRAVSDAPVHADHT